MLLKITNGAISFGVNTVLSGIDFEINKGEKIAIVGRNGCGKTTLLKLIDGEYNLTPLDNGEDSSIIKGKNVTIGCLKQITFSNENISLEDELRSAYQHIIDMEFKLKELLQEMESNSNAQIAQKYTELLERFNLMGGYSYKKEYEIAIKQFGFSEDDKKKSLNEFSGGQRTKIAFIKLFLSKPDILLLDEPTNHLDIAAIEWLEEYLKNYKNAIVIVAHDREFLDKIVNIIFEIERGKITKYIGNYTDFALKKRLSWELQQKKYIEQQKEISNLNGLADRFRAKATKASMAQSKLKQIERMEKIEAPELADMRSFHANFVPEYKSSKLVLSTKNLEIGYDSPLSILTLDIMRCEKVGIIGGNGLGKSTFLKTIISKIPQLSGTYTIGNNVKIGYFDQQMIQYKSDKTVLDEFWDEFPSLGQTEVRSTLGAFLFSQEDVFKSVNNLSGGEKARLALCKILKRKPNFLILDEPTNHMDIIGKETLEKVLHDYSGTLLFVSHDRYFIKQIATSLLVFTTGNVYYYPYGYEHYLANPPMQEKNISSSSLIKKPKRKYTTPAKEKAKRDTKIKKLELLISQCDEQIAKLHKELESNEVASDYIRLTEIQDELFKLEEQNLDYLTQWDVLTNDGVDN